MLAQDASNGVDMELTTFAAALLRRWYAVALGLLLTAGLAYVAFWAVPPTYSAAGSVLLLPPSASVPEGSNQLLQLSGLDQPASLVVAYLAGDDVRESLAGQYPDVTYDVVSDPLSRGPLVMMTVEGPSPGTVMTALDAVLATVPDALGSLQDQVDAPPPSRFTSMPLSVDTEPTEVVSSTVRALIAAVGAGLAVTFVGVTILDSVLVRRPRRHVAGAVEPATPSVEAQLSGPTRVEPTGAPSENDSCDDGSVDRGRAVTRNRVNRDDTLSEASAQRVLPRT
ncbi:hypothetical protein [Cellulomonas fimi]|uniref:Lipopolysaccharide biosynthesis protein n=1 Tax=Cellulomonas fimi TaxID=1708 RepID=A0A7Y0QIH0_CELFI|nr:hypothetical protein [Cellulomonas fimi]NMR21345.1 hypothetical protein [Cellulomonas fimi]